MADSIVASRSFEFPVSSFEPKKGPLCLGRRCEPDVAISDKARKILLRVTEGACGILGLALFMWTPKTGQGILVYMIILAVLIVFAIILSPLAGYWPKKPEGS
jgi:hypothetical protein